MTAPRRSAWIAWFGGTTASATLTVLPIDQNANREMIEEGVEILVKEVPYRGYTAAGAEQVPGSAAWRPARRQVSVARSYL